MGQTRTATLLLIMSMVLAACGSAPPTATTTSVPAATETNASAPTTAPTQTPGAAATMPRTVTAVASAAPLTARAAAAPVGIIAIGHSGLTGENSNPNNPGRDAPENSWATGTAAAVNSVYQRLVAARPETAGHVANLARGGAPAADLGRQARAALAIVPTPELVLIQTIDNDIRCDGSDPEHVPAFGDAVSNALRTIVETSPNSQILLVSQPGRPIVEVEAIIPAFPDLRSQNTGDEPCAFFNPDGSTNHEHIAGLTAIIESYEAEQQRVCATVPQCSTDDGAFARYVPVPGDRSSDGNHLSVEGHARLAEVIWPSVAERLGLQ